MSVEYWWECGGVLLPCGGARLQALVCGCRLKHVIAVTKPRLKAGFVVMDIPYRSGGEI